MLLISEETAIGLVDAATARRVVVETLHAQAVGRLGLSDPRSMFLRDGVIRRDISARMYAESNLTDPAVHAMIDRIRLEHGPEFDLKSPAAEVIVELRGGRVLKQRIDRDTMMREQTDGMSDAALAAKFAECAGDLVDRRQIDRIMDAGLRFEKLDGVGAFMDLLRIERRD